jgi:hypothetical protein
MNKRSKMESYKERNKIKLLSNVRESSRDVLLSPKKDAKKLNPANGCSCNLSRIFKKIKFTSRKWQ